MPRDVRLLPTRRERVFGLISNTGLSPGDFNWSEETVDQPDGFPLSPRRPIQFLTDRLTYVPKPEFYFIFGGSASLWSPGSTGRNASAFHNGEWPRQEQILDNWLAALKREIAVNDPWETLNADLTHTLGDAETAAHSLTIAGAGTARGEIEQAHADIKKAPPDLTGAVQHALSALECVARKHAGNSNATLGDLIKKFPGLLPPPLDQAMEKIWGFASNHGRHLREGGKPDAAEVELLVGLATVCCTYVARKIQPAPQTPRRPASCDRAPRAARSRNLPRGGWQGQAWACARINSCGRTPLSFTKTPAAATGPKSPRCPVATPRARPSTSSRRTSAKPSPTCSKC
jgi:hypothetical protein